MRSSLRRLTHNPHARRPSTRDASSPVCVCVSAEKAQLCLFGSSKNGFGFRDSDLDICMTLEGHETAEVKADFGLWASWRKHTHTHTEQHLCSEQNLNCKEIIEGLAKVLKKHTGE